MADGQVVFEITADGSRAISGVRDVTRNIEHETSQWDRAAGQSAGNMESSMISAVKNIASAIGMAQIGKMILDWGKAAVDAASDLAEVQNVVDVTFGEGASKIDAWAKQAGASFGLTETQAKKFTSTLGAMMKSAGLSGSEIVDMSTDLSGLASDMASFYNLDFETAFQKIRAGISGETEPLKQLGVNMSVANLEAFALEKGITKAFNKMSQSEQVMLRYQYLMSATADAQGDFARTSDGFANAQRRVETAIDSIKTNVGNLLLPAVEAATGAVANFLTNLTAQPERTVLDDIKDIDLKTEAKLADITTVSEKAQGLIDKLDAIKETTAGDAIGKLAEGANKLDASSPATWSSILTSLQGVDGLQNLFSSNTAANNVTSLADALSNSTVDESKASAWNSFLSTLSENASALSAYTGQSESDIRTWIGDLAARAKELDPNDVTAWDDLFADLTQKLGITAEDVERITGIKNGANALKTNSVNNWRSLFAVLQNVDGLGNVFGAQSNASGNIEALAGALSGASVDTNKAEAWKTLLGALSENSEAVSKLTGKDAEETKKWLDGIAESVNGIDANDADAWNNLLTTLVSGFTGTPEGQQFVEGLAGQFLALGADSEEAVKGLTSLGFSSTEISEKQSEWLKTCKELVKTIPGLSQIINTETGEVKGGTEAVSEYVKAWEEGRKKLTLMKAVDEKKTAIATRFADLPGLELDMVVAERRVRENRKKMDAILKKYGMSSLEERGNVNPLTEAAFNTYRISEEDYDEFNKLAKAEVDLETSATEATKAYNLQHDALVEAETALEEYKATVDEMPGSIDDATIATEEWDAATQEVGKKAVAASQEAIKALADYVQKAREATEKAVDKTIGGFESVDSSVEKLRKKSREYANDEAEVMEKYGKVLKKYTDKDTGVVDLEKMRQNWKKLPKDVQQAYNALVKVRNKQSEVNEEMNKFKPEGMKAGLQSQLEFMKQYTQDLAKAREMGLSEKLLASLSDGSAESAEYLHGLLTDPAMAKEIDDLYGQVEEQRKGFVNTLTQQQLSVDKTYDEMVKKAKEAIGEMDLGTEAATASGKTVSGLAKGISDKVPEVQAAVDSVCAELDRLSGWGINVGFGDFGSFSFGANPNTSRDGRNVDIQPFETGLDYVPFNGFLAELHAGEGILTAEENRVWQRFKNGGIASQNVDYDALGGVMRDNVKPGGDVYLDGRVVGSVISAQQGKSFRTLQRSGWQG